MGPALHASIIVFWSWQLKGKGNKALQAGDYDEAIKYYTEVCAGDIV